MKIYHNPRCRKSRESVNYLADKNIDFEIIEYLKERVSENMMKSIKIMKFNEYLMKSIKLMKLIAYTSLFESTEVCICYHGFLVPVMCYALCDGYKTH